MIGKQISHYHIIEKLGEGGMGIVYKAEDTKLNRTVALKFLPPEMTRDPAAKARFIHEAQAASALQHHNICTIHDVDETDDGQIFIVMDYYQGESLKDRINIGESNVGAIHRIAPTINECINITMQIAHGLQEAHSNGIVHRDIKPANIMITDKGEVKIMDFGLAKLAGRTMLTKSGTTLGTVAYMSPEQTRGEAVDHRTDIWSLGMVLYEMITGRPPFKGKYDQAVIYGILNEEPEPLTAVRTGVPMELERITSKMLAKNPAERYQHLDELLVDLRSCLKVTGQTSAQIQRPVSPVRKSMRLFWYGALAGLIGLTLIVYFLVPREEKTTSRLKMIAVLPFENLGPPEDEYFADGLTDEITSRLSLINRLGVISRTSSIQYKKTSKTLPLIAKELGVDYILEGTIRWVKTGGSERIRITPQLIKVSGDVHLWADNMDRTIDDIFAIQTEIAMRVVKSLDIVLGEGEKHGIEMIPTKNLEAYQAYLRGLSYTTIYERSSLDMWIKLFQRAVQLDSTFAMAYVQLSWAHLRYYWFGFDRTKERFYAAKQCLDRAFALQPELPRAHFILGYYYYYGFHNYDRALEAFAAAEKGLPNNSAIQGSIAYIWRRQGKFEQALVRQKKAFELDPKNLNTLYEIGLTLSWLGVYADAEEYFNRFNTVLPDQSIGYIRKAEMYLQWLGDTRKSRSELERVPKQYYPWAHLTWLDIYEHNYQQALDRLNHAPTSPYEDQYSVIPVSQLRGLVYWFMNDSVRSHASFDSARLFLESEIKKKPDDDRLHSSLGIVYAGLGRSEAAVKEAELAMEQLPISLDAIRGVFPLISLAHVYTMVGKYDTALDKLEYLMSLHAPKVITAPILRLDPIYNPLRSNPRFQALLSKGE
jgi:serine/threonine protein kinase/tetratricopeptide (TPR) repeat protein